MSQARTYFNINGADSIIGPNVLIEGPLAVHGDLTIEGDVRGDVKASGGVIVGINANVWSNIEADTVSVSGKVTGNIHTDGKTTIREMGTVTGNINSEGLSILPGGNFVGCSRIHRCQPEPTAGTGSTAKQQPAKAPRMRRM